MVVPAFHDDGANGVEHDDSVGALAGGHEYEVVATMPKGEVLSDERS